MCEVTMRQAELQFPTLIKKLQTGEESVVYITDDGKTVAKLTLADMEIPRVQNVDVSKRIGIAKGKFTMPKDFDKWDKDIFNT